MTDKYMKDLMDNRNFFHHFQPLYNISTDQIIGYEVLFRSSLYHNPEKAFQTAKENGKLFEFEMSNIEKAITTYGKMREARKDVKLFLNVYPSTIIQPDFLSFIEHVRRQGNISKNQIILELNESEIIPDMLAVKSKIVEYQEKGILIAVDDFGKGTASLKALMEFAPNIVKMDRYFVHEITKNPMKQSFIYTLVNFRKKMNIQCIQEGIEQVEDLVMVQKLGVAFAQGYFLGKPKALDKISWKK